MPKRRLTSREVSEARLVFGDTIDYPHVWVAERQRWLSILAQVHTGIALGNTIYFSRSLYPHKLTDIAWLIHELTHVWQFQHFGWIYLLKAIQAHVYRGAEAYNYGEEAGLAQALKEGKSLRDFNPEQQGDICKDYYILLKSGESTLLWEPLIQDLRRSK